MKLSAGLCWSLVLFCSAPVLLCWSLLVSALVLLCCSLLPLCSAGLCWSLLLFCGAVLCSSSAGPRSAEVSSLLWKWAHFSKTDLVRSALTSVELHALLLKLVEEKCVQNHSALACFRSAVTHVKLNMCHRTSAEVGSLL